MLIESVEIVDEDGHPIDREDLKLPEAEADGVSDNDGASDAEMSDTGNDDSDADAADESHDTGDAEAAEGDNS